jgi:phosphoserine phosphatase RsbU/P
MPAFTIEHVFHPSSLSYWHSLLAYSEMWRSFLLPLTWLPDIPGFGFFADYHPSSKASGDYYDFIRIDDEYLGILVADVSGHGSPAAVIMAMMRVVLRSFLSTTRSQKEVLEKINQSLCDNQKSGHFITAFYGVVHLPTRCMNLPLRGITPLFLLIMNPVTCRNSTPQKDSR